MAEALTSIAAEIQRFYLLVDHGHYEDAASLFIEGGELVFGPGSPKPGTLKGSAIEAALVARRTNGHPVGRHVSSNLLIEPAAEGFDARSVLVIYRLDEKDVASLFLLADVAQSWIEKEGKWKMVRMEILPVSGNGSHAAAATHQQAG